MDKDAALLKYPCKPCSVCGGQNWESSLFPGKKYPTKQACEQAVVKHMENK